VRRYFDSIKGRVVAAFVVFVTLAHMGGLWLYSVRSEAAIDLLHDTLVAEQVALLVRVAEASSQTPHSAAAALKPSILNGDGSLDDGASTRDANRSDVLRHLLGALLGREADAGINVEYAQYKSANGKTAAVNLINAAAHLGEHHQRSTPISEIKLEGKITAQVVLANGHSLTIVVPALTATSFSLSNLGAAIAAVVLLTMLAAIWMLNRWTQPLAQFAAAATRLGADIGAPPLPPDGLHEVRSAANAFNEMQSRIRRLIEDRSAMAAAIAHDLGTPVTRLRLRAEEIEDEVTKQQILNDIEQMRRMMSSTLEYSRASSESLKPEPFDLTSLAQAVCTDFTDLGCDVSFHAIGRQSIVSDATAVRRVLLNLLDNAIKHGRMARVSLEGNGTSVRMLVDDTGPGIPVELREVALAPFRRLDAANGEACAGSGLGLAVAQNLVTRLGGQIELQDSPLGGLRAIVVLPRLQHRD